LAEKAFKWIVSVRHGAPSAMTQFSPPKWPFSIDPSFLRSVDGLQRLIDEDRKAKIQIAKPDSGASLTLPVDLEANWTKKIESGSFRASINGRDVTALFVVDEAGMKAVANGVRIGYEITWLAMESMSLVVSANLPTNIPIGWRRQEDRRDFLVAGPSFDFTLTAALIPSTTYPGWAQLYVVDALRGSTALVGVNLQRKNSYISDVQVQACAFRPQGTTSGPFEAGITFNAPFIMNLGADHGLLQIKVDPKQACGVYTVAVNVVSWDDDQSAPDHGSAKMALIQLTVY